MVLTVNFRPIRLTPSLRFSSIQFALERVERFLEDLCQRPVHAERQSLKLLAL
jgi:hypothetical protein